MAISYCFVVLIGFLMGVISSVLLKKLALRYNLFVIKGMPLIGGISMGLSFIIACLFASLVFKCTPQHLIGIIISSLIMLIFGLIDDLRELNVTAKFFAQIIATSILVFCGVRTNIIYIGNAANIIITFIWVLGITNAFNLLDIMDGLAAGIAAIVSISFFIISFLNADINAMILTLSLTGPIVSFLIYNTPPAKIYMGNSGSHFLGFILAAIAIIISYASLDAKIALVSPLLILGFPIFDTIFLIFVRIAKRKIPFNKSNDHLALRLLALGYPKKKILLMILGLGLFFALCGVTISQVYYPLDTIIIILAFLVSFVLAKKFSKIVIYG